MNRTAIIYHIFCLCLLNWCRNRPGALYPNPSSHILPIWCYVRTGTSMLYSCGRTSIIAHPSSRSVYITSLDPRSQSTSSMRDPAPTGSEFGRILITFRSPISSYTPALGDGAHHSDAAHLYQKHPIYWTPYMPVSPGMNMIDTFGVSPISTIISFILRFNASPTVCSHLIESIIHPRKSDSLSLSHRKGLGFILYSRDVIISAASFSFGSMTYLLYAKNARIIAATAINPVDVFKSDRFSLLFG